LRQVQHRDVAYAGAGEGDEPGGEELVDGEVERVGFFVECCVRGEVLCERGSEVCVRLKLALLHDSTWRSPLGLKILSTQMDSQVSTA
jgi:hypothetical protein